MLRKQKHKEKESHGSESDDEQKMMNVDGLHNCWPLTSARSCGFI